MKESRSGLVLLKDDEWSRIDGEVCRVTDFNPLGAFINTDGQVQNATKSLPYAVINIECKRLECHASGYITHKIDFRNLWAAFKGRILKANEEVIIVWSKKNYKRGVKLFSGFMPKLWVMVCQNGAYELMIDSNHRPELNGLDRWNAMKPIVEWKPDVMA